MNRRIFISAAVATVLMPAVAQANPREKTLPGLTGSEVYETGEKVGVGIAATEPEGLSGLRLWDPVTAAIQFGVPAISARRSGRTDNGLSLYQLTLEDGSVIPFVNGTIGRNWGFGIVTIGQDHTLAAYYLHFKLSTY